MAIKRKFKVEMLIYHDAYQSIDGGQGPQVLRSIVVSAKNEGEARKKAMERIWGEGYMVSRFGKIKSGPLV